MSIRKAFNNRNKKSQAAFIPFVTVGDPNLEFTEKLIRAYEEIGADVIELGVPFSDPIADGPTIQKASDRALKLNINLDEILKFASRLRKEGVKVPFLLFSYLNPVLQLGLETFATRAKEAGIDGLLLVDYPPEIAEEYCKTMSANGIETVFLASPTTSPERLSLVEKRSSGFIYYVSRLGVTGARDSLSESLKSEVESIRSKVDAPVAVGFGISTHEQAGEVAQFADGVVVASALVKIIENTQDLRLAEKQMKDLAKSLGAASHKESVC